MITETKTINGKEVLKYMTGHRFTTWTAKGQGVGAEAVIRYSGNEYKTAVIESETQNYFRVSGRLFSKRDGSERGGHCELYLNSELVINTLEYYKHTAKIRKTEESIKELERQNRITARELEEAQRVQFADIEEVIDFTPTRRSISYTIGGREICSVSQRRVNYDSNSPWMDAEVSMGGTLYSPAYFQGAPLAIESAFKTAREWNEAGAKERTEARYQSITQREARIKELQAELETLKSSDRD